MLLIVNPLGGMTVRQVISFIVPRKHTAFHTGENPSQCSLCAVNIYNVIRFHMCENPYECNICASVLLYNQFSFQICVKYFQCSVSAIIRSNHFLVHTGEKPLQSCLYAVNICCLSRIRQDIKMLIRIILSIVNYYIMFITNMLLINMTFSCTVCGFAESARNRDNGICLDHYQLSIKHECFTSHSKVYFLVFCGSGNIFSIYLIISTTMLSFIHFNIYRMGLLRLVNFTPVRWSVTIYKYISTLYFRFLELVFKVTLSVVYWALLLTDMPFSCTFCGFELSAIYHKNSTSWQHHNVGSIICNCMLTFKYIKHYTTTLYICNG